jgi:hypothetical protein
MSERRPVVKERMNKFVVVHDGRTMYVRIWSNPGAASLVFNVTTAITEAVASWMDLEQAMAHVLGAVTQVEGVTAAEVVDSEGDGEVYYMEWP